MGTPGSSSRPLIFGISVLLAHRTSSINADAKTKNPAKGYVDNIVTTDQLMLVQTQVFDLDKTAQQLLLLVEDQKSRRALPESPTMPQTSGWPHLYEAHDASTGDITRSRDHGSPAYADICSTRMRCRVRLMGTLWEMINNLQDQT
jgi:hypothetical protein